MVTVLENDMLRFILSETFFHIVWLGSDSSWYTVGTRWDYFYQRFEVKYLNGDVG